MNDKSNKRLGAPSDVAAIRSEIRKFFQVETPLGKLGRIKWGVYAFYDYDGEPIYIGQTYEGLASRVGRHLTNQRTDAVAMNVLDPFEVAEICVWPLNLQGLSMEEAKRTLDQAEYALFQKVIVESKLGEVLNEKAPADAGAFTLPEPFRGRIIPDAIFPHRKHPDVRIARRARTIAELARVISEREPSPGLRRTLVTQARRLEKLAKERFEDFA
jgi:hypothetical protein